MDSVRGSKKNLSGASVRPVTIAQVAREAPNLRLIAAILLPLFTGMAVILAGVWPKTHRMYVQILPILLLLAIWLVVYVLQLRRQNRRVADRLREIDALRGKAQ